MNCVPCPINHLEISIDWDVLNTNGVLARITAFIKAKLHKDVENN